MHARTAIATTTLLLLATACSSTQDNEPDGTPPANPTPSLSTPAPPTIKGFGDTHTYPDDVTATADLTSTFTPSDEGFQGDDQPYALLTITLNNPTKQHLQLTDVFQDCAVDGQETLNEAFDGITSNWPDLVQAGKTGTWKTSCLLSDGEEMQYGLQIGDRQPVYWTGPTAQ